MSGAAARLQGIKWWGGQIAALLLLICFACATYKGLKGSVESSQWRFFSTILPFCAAAGLWFRSTSRLPQLLGAIIGFVLVIDGEFIFGLVRSKFTAPAYYAATLPLLVPSVIEGAVGASILGAVWFAFSLTVDKWIYGKTKKNTSATVRQSSS